MSNTIKSHFDVQSSLDRCSVSGRSLHGFFISPTITMECPKQSHADQIPYHQLMTGEAKQNDLNHSRPRSRKCDRDFLSKRQQALTRLCRLKETAALKNAPEEKQAEPQPENDISSSEDKLWNGASPLEKALISCCTTGDVQAGVDWEAEHDVEEDTWVTGALRETKILEFVGLAAIHCQDLASRSLVLAILERTHQLDEMIKENFEMTRQVLASQFSEAPGTVTEKEVQPSPSKRPRISGGDGTINVAASPGMVNPKASPSRRLMLFLGTKGLQILSRWVAEASEAVIRDMPSNGKKEVRSQLMPSPTGLLLLAMLEFLENIPFNKHTIVQSKINKVIKKLSKQVDSLVRQAQAEGRVRLEKWTHPDTGGLPVIAVQSALNKIKSSWEKKAKENSKGNDVATVLEDPLGRLNVLLKDRLDVLKKANPEEIEVEKEERKAPPAPTSSNLPIHFKNTTAEDKARKERENERHHLMKKDLEEARREKLELLKKLRAMKKTSENVEYARPSSRRGIRWKDGLTASSKQKRRDALESVFIFDKDHVKLVEYKTDSSNESQEESEQVNNGGT